MSPYPGPAQIAGHTLTVSCYVERSVLSAGLVNEAKQWRWGRFWARMRAGDESTWLLASWPVDCAFDATQWVRAPLAGKEQAMSAEGRILVSDEQARLKPCLRCGYSLRYIAGAKNCPECGLAVRVTLCGNTGLEWSNPRWQRFQACAFGVLALGMACRLLSFSAVWILYGADENYYRLGDLTLDLLYWLQRYVCEADTIICGLAICLLANGEGRHPDKSREVRRIALAAGILLVALGLFDVLVRHAFMFHVPRWGWYVLRYAMRGPWIPFVISALTCTCALGLGKRSGSRRLSRLSQVPLWPTAAGIVIWLLNIDRLFWPAQSVATDAAFPLSMIVMLVVLIRILLRGAREADSNWVTDP